MKVVVLAGGKGTRLGLRDRPKPMANVAGRPLLEHLVAAARANGLTEFIFLNGYLAEVIEGHFGDGAAFGARITHIREPAPLGTAGAVLEARALLSEPFLVVYGDILLDVDLRHFVDFFRRQDAIGALFVHPNDHPHDSDLVEVDDSGRILRFISKPHAPGEILPNLVSGAIYVLHPRALDFVPQGHASDWGHEIFPAMLAAGEALYGYRSLEYAKDVGTPERVARAEADLASGRLRQRSRRTAKPAIFLDRDGVLNREINGVHRAADLALLDGAGEAVRRLNRAGLPAVCVTNQPDLAKGLFTPTALREVLAALDTRLAEQQAHLDATYVCPHHPETGHAGEVFALKIDCSCRKPKPGLLLQAAAEHNLDLSASWLIGDRYCDVAAAKAAGARSVLVLTGHAGDDAARFNVEPDYIAPSVSEAVDHILEAFG